MLEDNGIYPNPQVSAAVVQYCRDHSAPLPQHIVDHGDKTEKAYEECAHFMISKMQAQFMMWFVKAIGAKKILEIGCFTGFSALTFAEALKDVEGAKIYTTDIDPKAIAMAKSIFASTGQDKIITLLEGPAIESMSKLKSSGEGPFDFIFLDANKEQYVEYFEYILDNKLLRQGGILAGDNVLKRGLVADHSAANPASKDEDQMSKYQALQEFNDVVAKETRVEAVILPVFDGLTFVRVK